CGSGRPANLLRDPHESRQSSVPADCGRYQGCTLLLRSRWSDAHVQLCEGPNSASLAFAYTRECIRLFSAETPAEQDYSSCTLAYFYLVELIDVTWART